MIISSDHPIVLASSNPGKIREIQAILGAHPILPQSQFKVVEAEETGSTFIENAILKARNASHYAKLPAIADDSGLVVDALDGAPGVISARFARPGASDRDNLDKLLSELEGVPENQRTARFICVMVFMKHAMDPCPVIAQGVWEGLIMTQAQGENGFGYDPVFWVPKFNCTSAQLSPEIKNSVSHRGHALRALMSALNASISD